MALLGRQQKTPDDDETREQRLAAVTIGRE